MNGKAAIIEFVGALFGFAGMGHVAHGRVLSGFGLMFAYWLASLVFGLMCLLTVVGVMLLPLWWIGCPVLLSILAAIECQEVDE